MAKIIDPVTAYSFYFEILGHYFGLFWRSRYRSSLQGALMIGFRQSPHVGAPLPLRIYPQGERVRNICFTLPRTSMEPAWSFPKALRTHILKLLGPKTILYRAFGLF